MAADPIFCIREAWQDGQLAYLSENDTQYQFRNDIAFPKDHKTAMRANGGSGDSIDLRTLVLVLRNLGASHGEFVKRAKGTNITYTDRKDLEVFLTGKKDVSKCLPAGLADTAVPNFEPAAKRLHTEDGALTVSSAAQETSAMAEVLGRERRLRDRNSQLLVPGKSFKRVLDFLQHAESKMRDKERAAGKEGAARENSGTHKSSASGSSRRREENGHAVPPPPPPGGPPQDPSSSAKPPRPPSQPSSSHKSRQPQGTVKQEAAAQKQREKMAVRGMAPIIIVPAAATANINMANAKDFLESGVYKQPHMALPDGAPRQIEERFMRTMGRKLPGVPYMVTSKAPKKSTEWNRVVAVFVTGQTWQFKDWPHKDIAIGNMAYALSKMLGVYVGLKGELVPDNIKQWNLLRLEVPKNDRHKDRPLVAEIYAAIDRFLAAQDSQLAY